MNLDQYIQHLLDLRGMVGGSIAVMERSWHAPMFSIREANVPKVHTVKIRNKRESHMKIFSRGIHAVDEDSKVMVVVI
jgi:hypothetical protein